GTGQLEALDVREDLAVKRRDAGPRGEQVVEPRKLGDPQGAGDLAQSVVEAEAVVVEPRHVRRASLVALAVDPDLVIAVAAYDHAALPRGELLVGVEREGSQVPPRPDRAAVGVAAAERLACVLDDPERTLRGDSLQRGHVDRIAEDVDGQKPGRPIANRRLRR